MCVCVYRLCACVYLCTYMYIYVYKYFIYIYIYTHAYLYICTYTSKHPYIIHTHTQNISFREEAKEATILQYFNILYIHKSYKLALIFGDFEHSYQWVLNHLVKPREI